MDYININGIEVERIIEAGKRLVVAHSQEETMFKAIYKINHEFPDIDMDIFIPLWVGINCKDRETIDGELI